MLAVIYMLEEWYYFIKEAAISQDLVGPQEPEVFHNYQEIELIAGLIVIISSIVLNTLSRKIDHIRT